MMFQRSVCFALVTGPTIKRRQLGKHLRRLRIASGVSREEAAGEIECSPTKITHLETGHTTPRKTDQKALLELYGACKEEMETLEELRQGASQRGWWSTARLPNWLAAYVGLEYDASALRVWELGLVPGLLQTRDYARTLIGQRGDLDNGELDRRVDARMRRQERLTAPTPLRLEAVVSEMGLAHLANEADLAGEQFGKLIESARLPNVELYVLPVSAGLSVGLSGAFSLLDFPEDVLPPAAYQEYIVGGHVIDDQSVVSEMDTLYRKLRCQTLGTSEGLAFIAELAENT